jgi:hypothetical protein
MEASFNKSGWTRCKSENKWGVRLEFGTHLAALAYLEPSKQMDIQFEPSLSKLYSQNVLISGSNMPQQSKS